MNPFQRYDELALLRERLTSLEEIGDYQNAKLSSIYGNGIDTLTLRKEILEGITTKRDDLQKGTHGLLTSQGYVSPEFACLEHLRAHPNALLGEKYFVFRSLGALGKASLFLSGASAWSQYIAFILEALDYRNLKDKQPRIAFVGTEDCHHTLTRVASHLPANEARVFGCQRPFKHIVAELNDYQPNVLIGYSSVVEMLLHASAHGYLRIRPKRVVTGTDYLQSVSKRQLLAQWNSDVAEYFGLTECGMLAISCDHGSFHLLPFSVVPTLVESNTFLTPLFHLPVQFKNFLSPEALIPKHQCACGSLMPTIVTPVGRRTKLLHHSSHPLDLIHPIALRSALDLVHGIDSFRLLSFEQGQLHIQYSGSIGVGEIRGRLDEALFAAGARSRLKIQISRTRA